MWATTWQKMLKRTLGDSRIQMRENRESSGGTEMADTTTYLGAYLATTKNPSVVQ